MVYFTFNDQFSGVFKSQVIDVALLLEKINHEKVTLVCFFPRQNFRTNSKKVKSVFKGKAIFIPIISISFWKINYYIFWILLRILNDDKVLCRGPIATYLALKTRRKKQKIAFDARGATKAEITEFDMGLSQSLISDFIQCEEYSVLKSDFKISISEKLVDYWKHVYNYNNDNHVIIPCTVTKSTELKTSKREEFGYKGDDLIFIYSGGIQGWQGIEGLEKFILNQITSVSKSKFLFMCPESKFLSQLIENIGSDIIQRIWVAPEEVNAVLGIGDYGILWRDDNVTNIVSSPTKFAEYLMIGLPVIISPKIGDYSEIVEKNKLGIVIHSLETEIVITDKWSQQKRNIIKDYAEIYLSKSSDLIKLKYQKLFQALSIRA